MRRLQRWCFPTPIWHLLILAAIPLLSTMLVGLQVENWAYVSLSHLSGLPREAIQYAGPIVAAATAYLAGPLCDARSPVSSAASQRRSNGLLSHLAISLGGSAVVGHAVGAVVLLSRYAPQARAGRIDWVELALGPVQLIPFVLVGILFALGGLRWWLAPTALVVCAFWIHILPILIGGLLPTYPYSVGHEFLFPATPAYRHEEFSSIPIITIFIIWIGAVWVLFALARFIVRRQGSLSTPLVNVLVPVALVAGLFFWASVDDSRFYGNYPETEASCEEDNRWTFCVMPEEADLLEDFMTEASIVRTRSGPLGKPAMTILSTGLALSEWERPQSDNPMIEVNISNVGGVASVRNDIAGPLAGLDVCEVGESLDESTLIALGLAQWLTGDPYYIETNEYAQRFDAMNKTEREEWFTTNTPHIATCSIDDKG